MCDKCKGQVSDAFVRGIATILWADAWASHVEEHECSCLAGVKIEEVMPEIPEPAWRMAERFAGAIEQANGLNLPALFAQAMRHTGREMVHEDYWGDDAERFGECLAWMGMGAGVSWYDDHPEFKVSIGIREPYAMIVPRAENYLLRVRADETCED
jgi:hypothetical protein